LFKGNIISFNKQNMKHNEKARPVKPSEQGKKYDRNTRLERTI